MDVARVILRRQNDTAWVGLQQAGLGGEKEINIVMFYLCMGRIFRRLSSSSVI